ncbi:MAG TPA: protein kinase, partial [Dongiaceae bacterium]|nr:protein kinase [Dongiaceae bacterium]
MSEQKASLCPQCGKPLPADAPAGLCPVCLMAMNLATHTDIPEATQPTPREVPPPPTPGEIALYFPQLEIIRCIGRGGMGAVYEARQKSLNRLVALKILAPEREKDAAFGQRFATEAEILARLNHPNIITIHDFGTANGMFYLVMEFVDGVNLRQLLRSRKLTPEEALAVVPPLCDALQFAHERGIVHRDIKPENILLDKTGRVKIADFGIAKMLGPVSEELGGEKSPPENVTQNVVGTRGYSAPEQQQAPRLVDSRADIYSLGVVFYEMLTGELPGKKIEPPSQKVQVDVRLDEIVLRALAEKPELRYQQASAFKTQVETILTSQPADSGGSTNIRPAVESGFRPLPRWAILALGGLLLLAALGLTFELVVHWHDRPTLPAITLAWIGLLGMAWLARGRLLGKICGWTGAILFVPLILTILFLSVEMESPTEPVAFKLPTQQLPQPIPLAPAPRLPLPPTVLPNTNSNKQNSLAATFGAVSERELTAGAESDFLNLNTGEIFKHPTPAESELQGDAPNHAFLDWAAVNGVSLGFAIKAATGKAELVVLGMGLHAFGQETIYATNRPDVGAMAHVTNIWNDLPAGPELTAEFQPLLDHKPVGLWFSSFSQDDFTRDPALFQTREGRRGLLQILNTSENPRRVTLRYKLEPSSALNTPATINASAQLRFQAAEQDLNNTRKRVAVGVAPPLDLERAQLARDIAAAELNGDTAKVVQLREQAAELEFKIAGQLHAVGKITDADFQKAKAAYDLARAELHP